MVAAVIHVGTKVQAVWLPSCPPQRHGGVKQQGPIRMTAWCLMRQEWRDGGRKSQGWNRKRKPDGSWRARYTTLRSSDKGFGEPQRDLNTQLLKIVIIKYVKLPSLKDSTYLHSGQ